MLEVKIIEEGTKEYYEEEIKEIYDKIEEATRQFYYLDYDKEVGSEITEEIEKACDSLYESERHLSEALNLLRR